MISRKLTPGELFAKRDGHDDTVITKVILMYTEYTVYKYQVISLIAVGLLSRLLHLYK